ncbi:hypothetical protein [Nocardioides daeguensis]|uniref:Uncharacterized protein n=1 Tax=Nocardioides daeguensis TaxID=908359 RepID=A0ABP6UW36_9ACTN|nr:hypothetical protein [Nocardioides daeguensis]
MAWQHVFTWVTWGLVGVMLVAAVLLGRRHRTPFYLFAILAAGVAAFAEPLYDVAFDLHFYDYHDGAPGGMWSHFTAFDVVQPNWTHSGYIVLYAGLALYGGKALYDGRVGRRGLFLIWSAEIATSCVFEVIGTGTDVYTYYGAFEMRLWNYPLVIGVLEGTQVVLFTTLAVLIWRRVETGWGLAGLMVAFPITFFGTNFGVGAPVIIALHLDDPARSSSIVLAATFLSMALCAVAVYGASKFLPRPLGAAQTDEVRAPHVVLVG